MLVLRHSIQWTAPSCGLTTRPRLRRVRPVEHFSVIHLLLHILYILLPMVIPGTLLDANSKGI
jgi:hypothetical protein